MYINSQTGYNNTINKELLGRSSLIKIPKTKARDFIGEVIGWFDHLKSYGLPNNSFSGKSASRGGSNTTFLNSGNLKRKYSMSITAKVLRHLLKGNTVTAAEISGKFGSATPTEVIRQLRMKGYAIYANKTKLWDGTPTTKYRIGTPSRAMVAAAYRAAGFSVFK